MSKPQEDYIEVNFSSEKDSLDVSEGLSFQEKIVEYEQKIDDAMEEYRHGKAPEYSNVSDEFLLGKVERLKKEYVKEISEANEEEYHWWLNETVDRLLCGCINNPENENPENSEKLMETFKLYRRAKKTREDV